MDCFGCLRPVAALVLASIVLPGMTGAALAWQIAPHRALYQVELAQARRGAQISAIRGQMMFEWAASCDGWQIDQRYRMTFTYTQGNEVVYSTNYTTWETRDGREFHFSMVSANNGDVDDNLRGVARLSGTGEGGTVHYRLPEREERSLPRGTLFPTAHTIAALERAEAGEQRFNAVLFDGTSEEGLNEINAIIGDRIEPPGSGTARSPLLERPSWPLRLAFFPISSPEATPEYEMSVRLYDNGVVDEMLIDYGSFVIRATLTEIEPLPDGGC